MAHIESKGLDFHKFNLVNTAMAPLIDRYYKNGDTSNLDIKYLVRCVTSFSLTKSNWPLFCTSK